MLTPFKIFEEEIFPKVHSYVIHNIKDTTQATLAEKLGITQAMVSKYLLKKTEDDKITKELGEKIISGIRNNLTKEELNLEITKSCINLMQSGNLCNTCSKINNFNNCNACMNLGTENKDNIINNIKKAISTLEKANPIELMPEVSINIAMCKNNAKTKAEVASIPGRIVKINNKIKASNQPEFNSSNHLANLLLKTKQKNPEINAIINIKYSKDIEKSLRSKTSDIIIDKGGFGIEPCIYILGKDAIDVVNKAIKIKGIVNELNR